MTLLSQRLFRQECLLLFFHRANLIGLVLFRAIVALILDVRKGFSLFSVSNAMEMRTNTGSSEK